MSPNGGDKRNSKRVLIFFPIPPGKKRKKAPTDHLKLP
jgi:hypothetical protein